MIDSTQLSNLIGAILANLMNILLISIFIARLSERPKIEHWLGIILLLSIVPLTYLFISGISIRRPLLYFIQIGLMMTYLVVEFLLDYLLKVDFRQTPRIVIPYLMLFFSGAGGMIGVASQAGRGWSIVTIISFLLMVILSLVQRYLTGQ
jgi:hypothetical protein